MFNINELFSNRFGRTLGEWLRYGKYILNGHLMIVLLFLIGYVAFSYQKWLQAIPEDFPIIEIVTIVLALFMTYSAIFTYLLNADRIFLLPLENRMGAYFSKAVIISILGHGFLLFIILGICMPLLKVANDSLAFFQLLLVFILVKVLNLGMRWYIQLDTNKKIHTLDLVGRFILNSVLIYLLLSSNPLWLIGVITVIYLLLLVYYYSSYSKKGYKWDFLIDQEENRMMKFYRFANMFAEVPHLRNEVKRRKYLDWILTVVPYDAKNVYVHLYVRAFLRSGDYFGLVLRLSFIGLLFISFVNSFYGVLIFGLIFTFLTAFQLIGLFGHFDYNLFISLYPIDEKEKRFGFKKVYQYILLLQTIILSIGIGLLHTALFGIYNLVIGVIFILVYYKVFVEKKLE